MVRYLKTKTPSATGSNISQDAVSTVVKGVIDKIRSQGDVAVRQYSEKFDKWSPSSFKLSKEEIEKIISTVPEQTIKDIKEVQANIREFAIAQRNSLKDFELEIQPGVFLGQKANPIAAVGTYIPGGRYPLLASAHMTILTAKVAGVPNVIGCTPPIGGKIPNATVAAMHFAGADEIFILGGVQARPKTLVLALWRAYNANSWRKAVAAMAVGTETIRKVDFIAGPGNAFVAEAKRQLFGEVGIDLFAGPTEVLIVADEHADPFTTATDLISQAEHGPDSPAVLITTSEDVGRKTIEFVRYLLESSNLSTAEIAKTSWTAFGEVILVSNLDEAYALADEYAFEHVQIFTQQPREALKKMTNYGALFLGEKTCVSYGDKVIGTNHVLPTRKASRYTGGLSVLKFLRSVTYQEVSSEKASGELGRLCGRAARAETFEGHARSGDLRASKFLGDRHPWIDGSNSKSKL